jgi:hypothetical protein
MPSRDLTGLPLDTPNRGSIDEVVSLVQELIHKHSKVCPDSQRAAEEMRRSMTGLKQEFSKVLDAVEGLESKILKNNSTIDQGTGRPRYVQSSEYPYIITYLLPSEVRTMF